MLRKSFIFFCVFGFASFLFATHMQNLSIDKAFAETNLSQLKQQSSDLYNKGAYNQALPVAQQYVQAAKQQFGETNAEYGAALSLIGRIHFANGNYTQATPYLENALKIREKALGANSREVAKDLENLAELYYALVLFDKADALVARAKKIAQK